MGIESNLKVKPEHLNRIAYVYIRQSSLKQVLENTESTKRQYALRERAMALGWHEDRIVVIDSDLGQSAAPGAADRDGFEKLVTDACPREGGDRHGAGGNRDGTGGVPAGTKLQRLASAFGNLRRDGHARFGSGRAL